MCSRNTVRESWHISFFCGGDPFLWSRATAGEHTRGSRQVYLSDQRTPPSLEWPACLCLLSKITDLIYLFKFHAEIRISFSPTYFSVYGWLSELTYFGFFLIICWSCLRTEISVTLSIGNKLYSLHHLLFLFFLWNHFVDVILRPHWIC